MGFVGAPSGRMVKWSDWDNMNEQSSLMWLRGPICSFLNACTFLDGNIQLLLERRQNST